MSRAKKRDPKTFKAARSRIIDASFFTADETFDRHIAELKECGTVIGEDEETLLREGFVSGFRWGAMMAIDMVTPLFKDEIEEAHARRVAIGKANAERQRQQVRDKLAALDAAEGKVAAVTRHQDRSQPPCPALEAFQAWREALVFGRPATAAVELSRLARWATRERALARADLTPRNPDTRDQETVP